MAERLIADSGGGQDRLPLIQHGLIRLWRRKAGPPTSLVEPATPYQHGRLSDSPARFGIDEAPSSFRHDDGPVWRLTLEDYQGAGSLADMLSAHADEVLAEAAPDANREKIVEHLFRALTDINAEGSAVRRPQTFDDLRLVTGSDEQTLRGIIDRFRADGVSFLRPYGNDEIKPNNEIDISHEALIRCWQKIADDKEDGFSASFGTGSSGRRSACTPNEARPCRLQPRKHGMCGSGPCPPQAGLIATKTRGMMSNG